MSQSTDPSRQPVIRSINSNDLPQLEGQSLKYLSASHQQKLDIAARLFQIINDQSNRIRQLQANAIQSQAQAKVATSEKEIFNKFDEMIKTRNEFSNKQIENLLAQNVDLRKRMSKLQLEKNHQAIEIKLPSLEILNSERQSLTNLAKLKNLQSIISIYKGENEKYSKQVEQLSSKYACFTREFEQKNKQLNTKNVNLFSKNQEQLREINRLKMSESLAILNFQKKQKELEENRSNERLIFTFLLETLGLVHMLEAPNKLTAFLNNLQPEHILQSGNKKKIKQLIEQNNMIINRLKSQVQKAEEYCKQLSKNHQILTQQLNSRDIDLEKLKKKIQSLQDTHKQKLQIIDSLRRQIATITSKNQKDKQIINGLQSNIKTMETTIQTFKKEVLEQKDILTSQYAKIVQLQQRNIADKKTIEEQNTENKNLNSTKLSQQFKIKKLDQQIKTQDGQLDAVKRQKQLLNKKFLEKSNSLQVSQRTVYSLRQELSETKTEASRLTDQVSKLSAKISELELNKQKLEDDIKSLNRLLRQEKDKCGNLGAALEVINVQLIGQASHYYLGRTQVLRNITSDSLKELKPEISTLLSSWKDSFNKAKFFNGSAIITKENIRFVLDSLEQFMGSTPSESKLVYKYDPFNPTNFHNYFDRVENLIVFIKISNGTIIGGFTVYPIDSERIQRPGRGFLFSLTGKKVYHIRSDAKLPVVSYDKYYFIFGNAEIRLKSQEQKVFSNFGIANSTFDNVNDPRTKFLDVRDMANNQLDFDTYEFYRMNFDL